MNEMSVREFIRNYEKGSYEDPSTDTMIDAGWYDWFCEDDELKPRLDAMFPIVKQIAASSKIDTNKMYVFFKNNCPVRGDLYDDFRFCEIKNGDLVYTIVPASGHTKEKGMAEVWGRENEFKGALAKGTWNDILAYFGVVSAMEYKDVNGNRKFIGKFGKSTQKQFDEALANLPELIAKAREGDEEAGQTANDLLWQLANESFNTTENNAQTFTTLHLFGKPEKEGVLA